MKNIKSLFSILLVSLFLISCIPQRKYQDLSEKQEQCEEENNALKARVQNLDEASTEFSTKMEVANRKLEALISDTAVLGTSLRILRSQYDKINALNEELLQKSSTLRAGSESENRALMAELEETRLSLQKKEDELTQLAAELNAKEEELILREETVNELRSLLAEKDSAVDALRQKVANALLGFEGKGLTIEQKNGKVYVRMEAKLLFATGSTKVDQSGKKAVIDLAKAIQDQDDLEILVEGHTDTDKLNSGSYPRDNWDLSVLRATSVINIMLENSSIDPTVLVAAGRSEYQPVDPSDKSKNRRIEVILTPNLDVLYDLINSEAEAEGN